MCEESLRGGEILSFEIIFFLMPFKKQLIKKQPSQTIGKIEPVQLVEEMKASYLDYAMSVIVSRALPDVRDGLKPVHRRILYAMWNLGLRSGAKYRKSATVVGEVLGKYHPHGDAAVYDSLTRMVQDFSLRYPLVDGQGNWGSIDGDSAAAMRYTEAKLTSISEEMLSDLEKNTIDFGPNYDGTQQEPLVLPAKLPSLILNGSMGIAVGMATNIPPHNLAEVCDGISYLIDHPEATVEELMKFIKGPDFPTGGIIYDINEIKQAYATGKGSITIRAKTDITRSSQDHWQIIVSEIPYQVNKADLLEKIAQLVREKKIEGIKDLRDETDKEGMRVVVDLRKDAYPQRILNQLFKLTQLQNTFYFNTLALVDGIQPKILNLKGILEEYIKHRQKVIKKRTEFDLTKTKEQVHILKGLKIALANIDEIVKLIKKSKDRDEAKNNLIKKFKLTEKQSIAILEMRLQQLVNLEKIKIEQELKDKSRLIKELEAILASPKAILKVIKKELAQLEEKYQDERRTKIVPQPVKEFGQEDLIPDEPCVVLITQDGYIKRLTPETFKTQARGGKGVIGLTTKEEDIVAHLFTTTTHADLLFFTTRGRVFQLKAYDVPQAPRVAKGQALVNFLQIGTEEKISAILSLKAEKLGFEKKEKPRTVMGGGCLIMVTEKGLVKKVDVTNFKTIRRSGLIALKLKRDDELKWIKYSNGGNEIVLITALGQAIRFKEKDVRVMSRIASGVRGIRLKKNDEIVGMSVIDPKSLNLKLLTISENGFGKKSLLRNYRLQSRGGTGIKTAKITNLTGNLTGAMVIDEQNLPENIKGDLIIVSDQGQVIRLVLKSIPVLGRVTQGVRLMRFKERGDKVASVTLV